MMLSKHKLSKANYNNVSDVEDQEKENVNISTKEEAASSQSSQSQSSTESVPRSPLATILPECTLPPKSSSDIETFPRFCRSKFDLTPTKPKPRNFPESALLRTPDRNGGGIQRHRFGWTQRNMEESAFPNMTPRSFTNRGKYNSDFSEATSTQNTPRSVSKPCISRRNVSGRAGNGYGSTSWYRGPILSIDCNQMEIRHFELKEDPLFWMEHNVQVLVRVRPLNNMEKNIYGQTKCLKQESSQIITWTGHPETRFMFDNVACETIDQETLFRMAGLPMVENCLSGYNSCIFAYGQTGSGKTYTMLGDIDNIECNPSSNRGMAPRIFEYLFARIKAEEERGNNESLKYNCKCSFIEIYNEQITDLLDPASSNLLLREDIKEGVYVENLSDYEVFDVGDIMKLLTLGSLNRKVAATNMNGESSRSHCVFTCVIESRWEKDSATNLRFARLNLVDLAGSERQKSSGAEGDRLKEAVNINKSLSTLGHVIMILVDVANGKPRHVPYRDSKLTFLLQDSLGGNSKTMIFANVSPSISCAAETLNTLKFAQRAKLIKNNAVVNEDSTADLNALKQQIRILKAEISRLKLQLTNNSPLVISHEIAKTEEECVILTKGHDHQANTVDLDVERNRVDEQLNFLKKSLTGALRREKIAEDSTKRLYSEIEHLNRLVHEREEDTRSTKMMLRFREDKIQRMESLVNGVLPPDTYLMQENRSLSAEIQLLQTKVEKNPEITRFASENIRLMNQVKRFQEFYEEGERESLISELETIREQLLFENEKSLRYNSENKMKLQKDVNELEECNKKLMEENENLTQKILEMQTAQINFEFQSNSQQRNEDFLYISPSECLSYCPDDKNSEDVLNLQLEIDILKIIIKEERSLLAREAESALRLKKDLHLTQLKLVESQKECKDAIEELNNTKLLITALESEQLLVIEELEEMRSNNAYATCLKEKDFEIQMLRDQISSFELKEQRSTEKDHENSSVQQKMKKLRASLARARMLNTCYQNDNADKESCADEMDQVRRQAEAETAEVIVSLQDELCILQQQITDRDLQEMESKQVMQCMEAKFEDLQKIFNKLSHDYETLQIQFDEKNAEVQLCSNEWEISTRDIDKILLDAQDSLEDAASNQLDCLRSADLHFRSYTVEKMGTLLEVVSQKDCLIDKLRLLKEAAMTINKVQQKEYQDKENEVEMLKLELSKIDSKKEGKKIIDLLSELCSVFQSTMFDFEGQVFTKIMKIDYKLNSVEDSYLQIRNNWCHGKKGAESSIVCAKFQDAESMLNTLTNSYEKDKLDGESSKQMVTNLINERDILNDQLQNLQFSNDQKDRYIDYLERLNISDMAEMNKLVEEVEVLTSQVFETNEKNYMSMKDDIENIAFISAKRGRLVKSWIEDVWSEIVVKDCSMSVFHLCYLGILLESITGINTENCLLHHGLCQSNAVISDLRSYNTRTTNELQMFRALKGKLLANIKSGFDQISKGEEKANHLHDVLANFDCKINNLQLQEEAMLQKASQMSIQIAVLMEDLNLSNSIYVESLETSRLMFKDEEELLNSKYEILLEKFWSKDIELGALKFAIGKISSEKTESDIYLRSMIENLQMELSVSMLNEEIKRSELKLLQSSNLVMEKEVYEANQASETLICKLNCSRSEVVELEQRIVDLGNDANDSVLRNQILKDELVHCVEAKLEFEKYIETLESENEKLRNQIKVYSDIHEIFTVNENCMRREIKTSRSLIDHLVQDIIVARVDNDLNLKLLVMEESKVLFLTEAVESAHDECLNILSLLSQSGEKNLDAEKLNLIMSCRINELEIQVGTLQAGLLLKEESDSHPSSLTILDAQRERKQYETDIYLIESSLERFLKVKESGDPEGIRIECLEKENRAIKSEIMNLIGVLALMFNYSSIESYKHENSVLHERIIASEVMLTFLRSEWHIKKTEVSTCFSVLNMKKNEIASFNKRFKALEVDNFQLRHTCLEGISNQTKFLTRIGSNFGKCLDTCARACSACEKLIEKQSNKVDFLMEKLLAGVSENDETIHLFLKEIDKLECDLLKMMDDITDLNAEMFRKDEILNGLLFDMALLQESASKSKEAKDELDKIKDLYEDVKQELHIKSEELDKCFGRNQTLQSLMEENRDALANYEASYLHAQESIANLTSEKSELTSQNRSLNEALEEKITLIENLETSLLRRCEEIDGSLETIESMRNELYDLQDEKDRLSLEIIYLNEELEKAHTFAETNEAIALEAKQIAESKSIYAEDKDAEVKLLEYSIEELECTINALENKVDILKGEAEKQRCQKEELEVELVTVKHQMQNLKTSDTEINSLLAKKEQAIEQVLSRLKSLERDITEKDKEVAECKAHITELNLHAEAQASEYKQRFKELETMVENVKPEGHHSNIGNSATNKSEKLSSRARGSGSPFKCIGLSHQVKSEKHEQLTAAKLQIEELESQVVSKQKEIFALNARLAAAESMTHDVIRDLLGVKLDITSYASLIDNQQSKNAAENATDSLAKEQDVVKLKQHLSEFIDERREWLEEIDKKQKKILELEMFRELSQEVKAENDSLKMENEKYKKCVIELQGKAKNTNQQNFFHQIHHHAKIKEENNLLKLENENLLEKLRNVSDFDDEQSLLNKLRETEASKMQLAQEMLAICTSIVEVAGTMKQPDEITPEAAEEAVRKVKRSISSLEKQVRDLTHTNRVTNERVRLFELKRILSPVASEPYFPNMPLYSPDDA